MPVNFDNTYAYQGVAETNELVLREAAGQPALTDTFGIKEGVKGKQFVHTLERIRKITLKDPGCGSDATPMNLQTTFKMWDPQDLKIFKYECWKELRGKVLEWKLKTLNDKSDLTNTDIEAYYLDVLSYAAYEDLVRLAWFADMSIASTSLTAGAGDVPNYNQFDGIWKQIFTAVTGSKVKRLNIAQNTYNATTNPNQDVDDEDAFPIFQSLFNNAPQQLKSLTGTQKQFLVSDSLMTAYLNYRESRNLDTSFDQMESGITTLKYRGVALQVVNEWDTTIAADFFKSGARDLPHRAILAQKGVLQLGFDAQPQDSEATNPFETWYSREKELWYARLKYVADSKLSDENRIIVAY